MAAIILSVLILSGIIFVLLPVFLGKKEIISAAKTSVENRLNELKGHKRILFTLLKDLEFEYQTGKISKSDFEKLHEEYKTKVIVIYQEMDNLAAEDKNTSAMTANNG